jgi:hypothetical protein
MGIRERRIFLRFRIVLVRASINAGQERFEARIIADGGELGIKVEETDDLKRHLTIAQIDKDQGLQHIGLVGDTYTITVSGDDTAGRFCVIDMYIPPGGGPPPHRHDFEETLILLEARSRRRSVARNP